MNPFDPMPTIESILGKTMAQDIEQSIMLAHLDDFEAPKCYHVLHNVDSDHHSGAAGFLVSAPCSHGDEYVCVKFVNWVLTQTDFDCAICNLCGQKCEINELTILPIGGKK